MKVGGERSDLWDFEPGASRSYPCNRVVGLSSAFDLQLSEFSSVDERPCQANHFP